MPTNADFDYYKLSHNSFDLFTQTVSNAIADNKYDLIFGGGDSGNITVWITNAIYEYLDVSPPDSVVIPSYRHADYAETVLFDNKILKSNIVLPNTKLKNILIVDDEAGTGTTIRGLLGALAEVTNDRPIITYIAEDDDLDLSKITGWNINFISPQPRVKDVYNAVSYIVPFTEYQVPVKKVLRPIIEDMNDKHVMATLLNLPVKDFNNGHPEFTFRLIDECIKQISNFATMQKDFQTFIRGCIKDALSLRR